MSLPTTSARAERWAFARGTTAVVGVTAALLLTLGGGASSAQAAPAPAMAGCVSSTPLGNCGGSLTPSMVRWQ